MKRNIWNLTKIICFVAILCCTLGCVYKVISWKDTTGDYLSSVQQLYHTGENLVDVAFVGSSRCYCSAYPAILWEERGITAFDMAISGQDKASSYHTLVELLKTQSPKVVFVEMYGLLFDRHQIESNVYRNMLSMRYSKNSVELVKSYVEEEKQKDFLARWPIVHTRYAELGKYDFIQYMPSVYGRGAFYVWDSYAGDISFEGADEEGFSELGDNNIEWLNELKTLADKEGFDLILYTAPFAVSREQQQLMNSAADYAASLGIEFVDCNKLRDEIGLSAERDFCDEYHCNMWGAKKVTEYFGKLLEEKYNLPDHRGDQTYELWDMDLKWFHCLDDENKLKQLATAEEYFDMLTQMDSLAVVISLETGGCENPEYYTALLEKVGIPANEGESGGVWLYQDGSVSKVMENDIMAGEYIKDLGRTDTLKVRYGGRFDPGNIVINRQSYVQYGYYMTVVTYNTFTEEVVQAKGF